MRWNVYDTEARLTDARATFTWRSTVSWPVVQRGNVMVLCTFTRILNTPCWMVPPNLTNCLQKQIGEAKKHQLFPITGICVEPTTFGTEHNNTVLNPLSAWKRI